MKKVHLTLQQGAFVAAPVGGLIFAAVAFALRIAFQWTMARSRGHHFNAFDRPVVIATPRAPDSDEEPATYSAPEQGTSSLKGKFF